MKFFHLYLIVSFLALSCANIGAMSSGERNTLKLLAKAKADLARRQATQEDDKSKTSVGMWSQRSISVTPESKDTKTIDLMRNSQTKKQLLHY